MQTHPTLKNRTGAKNPAWKGGRSEHIRDRDSRKYKKWRKAVFERDNYTCLICGKVGGEINAHHIKSFIKYPLLRYVVSNGMTLCVDCHKLGKKENPLFFL